MGRRTAKIFNGQITRWVWDGNTPLHEWRYELADRPRIVRDEFGFESKDRPEPTDHLMTWVFEEGTFKPAAKITSEQRYSILTDYLGTPVQMYDGQGELSWQAQLDVYGKVRTFTGASATDCPFRYQGQYEDEETGLYYNRFRYYSPEMGGYISQDPIRLQGGMQLYSYVKDANYLVDRLGLVETENFPNFDAAREQAFKIASGGNPNVTFEPTKIDPITGTEVEFKGSNGSKVAYDSAHPDMNATKGHHKPHVGVQTGGKRGKGGTQRWNLTYDGDVHPHRSNVKGVGDLCH